MEMKKIRLLLVVLLGLSRVLPADATDDEAAYLPLAVGNSWTYAHEYSNFLGTFDSPRERYSTYYRWPARGFNSPHEWYSTYYRWPARANELPYPHGRLVSITVQGTEVIDGKTYYVLSDLPDNWPPAPSYFIAGKKLRWAGTHLMERTADGERSVFRFDGANDAGYTVETDGVSSPIKRQGWFEYMELGCQSRARWSGQPNYGPPEFPRSRVVCVRLLVALSKVMGAVRFARTTAVSDVSRRFSQNLKTTYSPSGRS